MDNQGFRVFFAFANNFCPGLQLLCKLSGSKVIACSCARAFHNNVKQDNTGTVTPTFPRWKGCELHPLTHTIYRSRKQFITCLNFPPLNVRFEFHCKVCCNFEQLFTHFCFIFILIFLLILLFIFFFISFFVFFYAIFFCLSR